MINLVILIFVGGAFGAMCREFFMLGFPTHTGDFPLAIFLANVLASLLLGLSTGSRQRLRIHLEDLLSFKLRDGDVIAG